MKISYSLYPGTTSADRLILIEVNEGVTRGWCSLTNECRTLIDWVGIELTPGQVAITIKSMGHLMSRVEEGRASISRTNRDSIGTRPALRDEVEHQFKLLVHGMIRRMCERVEEMLERANGALGSLE